MGEGYMGNSCAIFVTSFKSKIISQNKWITPSGKLFYSLEQMRLFVPIFSSLVTLAIARKYNILELMLNICIPLEFISFLVQGIISLFLSSVSPVANLMLGTGNASNKHLLKGLWNTWMIQSVNVLWNHKCM